MFSYRISNVIAVSVAEWYLPKCPPIVCNTCLPSWFWPWASWPFHLKNGSILSKLFSSKSVHPEAKAKLLELWPRYAIPTKGTSCFWSPCHCKSVTYCLIWRNSPFTWEALNYPICFCWQFEKLRWNLSYHDFHYKKFSSLFIATP